MKILVPLNNRDDIKRFRAAGADELYFGFYDKSWTERFGEYTDINRMSGFNQNANRYDFSEIIDIIQETRLENMGAYVTMNANVYNAEALAWIKERYFSQLFKAGVNGVIVSTENIAKCALSAGLQVVASTLLGIYNSDIIRYYYSLGIRRIIVPRDLSLHEIAMIKNLFPELDLEVFFMRRGCVFSDAYCLGAHRKECGSTCGTLNKISRQIVADTSMLNNQQSIELNDVLYHEHFHVDACGMCALYRMNKMGVTSLKIVGRADVPQSIAKDIELIKNNMNILRGCTSEEEYLSKMIMPDNCDKQCQTGLSCYYPEVRFR